MTEEKKHHHLITAEIVFTEKGEEGVNAVRVNGVLIDENREIPSRLLGKAQQIVQLNFHQRMQSDTINVLDVALLNFSYLGHMTQEEFQAPPAGSKLQERTKPTLVPVADLETAVAQAGVSSNDE